MTNDLRGEAPPLSAELLDRLARLSPALDLEGRWPEEQWPMLAEAGVLRWAIPPAFGGLGVSQAELLEGYVRLAAACLTTTFILTQRNGACQRIAASPNARAQVEWLPALARGERFVTVGISHQTTSRQHGTHPAVEVVPVEGGWRFTGTVPWVTGAPHADAIVTGGTLADGQQVLAVVHTKSGGVAVGPPARLLALSGSQTSAVELRSVFVPEAGIISGPVPLVMKQGAGSTGSLGTSALAVGLSLAACRALKAEAANRPNLQEILLPLAAECAGLEAALAQASGVPASPLAAALAPEEVRSRANSLALRSTQALLAASKGAGFVTGHFAERAVREAMFFLVWSCPQPVVQAQLREWAGLGTC